MISCPASSLCQAVFLELSGDSWIVPFAVSSYRIPEADAFQRPDELRRSRHTYATLAGSEIQNALPLQI